MRKLHFILALIVALSAAVTADTYMWGGGGSDNYWSTAANWLDNAAPVDGDHTVYVRHVPGASSVLMDRDQTIHAFHMGLAGDFGTTTFTINPGSHLSLLYNGSGFSHIGQQSDGNTGTPVLDVKGTLTARYLGIGSSANGTVNVNGGTLNIERTAGSATTRINIGQDAAHGDGILNVLNGGTVNINRSTTLGDAVELWIGGAAGDSKLRQVNISSGTLNMNNGGTDKGATLSVGYGANTGNTELNLSGTGAINLTTGVNVGRQMLTIGHGSNSSGVFNQTGGALNISNGGGGWAFMSIGHGAGSTGTYNFSAGQFNTSSMNVGASGTGTMNISGTAAFNSTRFIRVGEGSSSQGTINMAGGTFHSGDYIALGYGASSQESALNLSGGSVTMSNGLIIGRQGNGTLNMTGGSLSTPWVRMAEGATAEAVGTWDMQGGTLTINDPFSGYISVGYGGNDNQHVLNMSGGQINTPELVVGRYSDGKIILSGGTIEITESYTLLGEPTLRFDTNGGQGVIVFSGGQLKWSGDLVWVVEDYIAAGKMLAHENNSGRLVYSYDGFENVTTVQLDDTAYNPMPTNDSGLVPPESPTALEWTNPFAGQTVYSDVWFGEDPTMNNASKVVDYQPVSSADVNLAPSKIYYWRVDTYHPVTSVKTVGVVWSFSTIPYGVHSPIPENGADDLPRDQILSWEYTDDGFDSFNIYLSTDKDNLVLQATQLVSETSFTPSLEYKETYYWRVDSVKGSEISQGFLWTFKVLDPQCTIGYAEGDLTGDCWVGIEDLAILMRNWLICGWDIAEACY